MRRLMLALALAAGLAGSMARADPAQEIRAVIANQIAAFAAEDFEQAFSYASPTIRQKFGSAARFGRMVQQGYPMLLRPAGIRFAGLAEQQGHSVQSVLVTDLAGKLYVVDYVMIPAGDGWQIDGVSIREAEGTSA